MLCGLAIVSMEYLEFAQDIVKAALHAGADEAEVYLQAGSDFEVLVRLGEVEQLTQASTKGLGLRIFADKRMAFASTTDFGKEAVADLVKTTVQLAKASNRDRFGGLPDVDQGTPCDLGLFDPAIAHLSVEKKIAMARAAEKAALEYDAKVTNSYGAEVSSGVGTCYLVNSRGIAYSSSGTSLSVWSAPVAEENGRRQIGTAYSCRRFLGEVDAPEEIGREAARRAIRKLGGRPVKTQKVPVVFDQSVGEELWGPIFSALDGDRVGKGVSFLKKKIGKQIASRIVRVIDDPLMPGGVGSMAFDGEGVITRRKVVIEDGVLQMYFYDARSARKYKTEPTGNARRSYSGIPHVAPTNFYLQPGNVSKEDIIRRIKSGLYVIETIGRGANIVTGDFSVGACGMWISEGELSYPVEEVTIAGNMLDMMLNIEEIANDIRFVSSVVSPTFKIAKMTVAGR